MRIHRCIALVIVALSLTMTSAHVLEMPQKLQYTPEMYAAVNGTLYRYFAIVGGAYEIGAIVAVATLAWRARHDRSRYWTAGAAVAVALAFVSWLIFVEPVNYAIARGASWTDLALRWEYGHLAGFVCSLAGLIALAIGVVLEIPVVERTIHVEVSRVIHAPPESLVARYLDIAGWPRLFPATIRGTREIAHHGSSTTVDVDHATAGIVKNVVTVVSPTEIMLDELKPAYRARFINRFEPVPEGCCYTVVADVVLRGALRALNWLAPSIARSRIKRYVIAPMQKAVEAS
ncbi:MAG: SRPBCC family protein [Kofleriaceae bacterium]